MFTLPKCIGEWGIFILNFYLNLNLPLTFVFFLFKATATAYGDPQAGAQNGAAAAGICHSHSNAVSELYLQPTPQAMATPDP